LRGCLSVLILAATFVIGLVWFGGPPIAETVVEASLTSAGFKADTLDVSVRADPPLLLALGRADRVEIEAGGVRWNGLHAGSMSLRLNGVDLLARTATTADGRFGEVELQTTQGDPALAAITITGPADRARTTIEIDGATVNRLALAAFEQEVGTRPDSAELVAPDRIRVRLGGNALTGTLRVEADGALVVATSLGTVRLVEPDSAIPFTLTGVSAGPTGLELTGTTDVESLLG
jgi:DUF2993 family protein